MLCGLLWISSFTWLNMYKVQPCCSTYQHFIPFYSWIMFHCRDAPHLIIHSSADGHLDCFHSLAVINNTATNIQLSSFYSCKDGNLLSWDDPSKAYNRRKQLSSLPIANTTPTTVSVTTPEGSSHPQSPQPSPNSYHYHLQFFNLQMIIPSTTTVSPPLPLPSLSSGSLKNLISTSCPICLNGMSAPLRRPRGTISRPWEQEMGSLPVQHCSLLLPNP